MPDGLDDELAAGMVDRESDQRRMEEIQMGRTKKVFAASGVRVSSVAGRCKSEH